MLKETIKYTDYNGTERTEDHYFNLTESEIIDMDMEMSGGLRGMLEAAISAQDTKTLYTVFKNIIFKSYGRKHIDGRRFEKSDEISREFMQTEAYNVLFKKLLKDDVAAADFIKKIIPQNIDVKKVDHPALKD